MSRHPVDRSRQLLRLEVHRATGLEREAVNSLDAGARGLALCHTKGGGGEKHNAMDGLQGQSEHNATQRNRWCSGAGVYGQGGQAGGGASSGKRGRVLGG